MELKDILSRLRGVKGPNGSGEYTARCPAHDDRMASLCLRSGAKGVVLKCQAGCSCEDVCAALGIEMRDLFYRAATPRRQGAPGAGSGAVASGTKAGEAQRQGAPGAENRSPVPGMKVHTPREFDSYAAAYGHLGTVEKIYPYRDENGRLMFEVARIRTADGGKTFRQHRSAQRGGKFPIICNVPAEMRNTVLYRGDEVAAAIRKGRPVYVVEGEKDADTIASFGYCGTTNAGGAGKWGPALSAKLMGADVIVIPDEDPEANKYAGQRHGEAIVQATLGIAKSVKLVRLRDVYPELPDKGDISDLAAILGADEAKRLLDKLVAEASEVEVDLYKRAADAYERLGGYCVDHGCVCAVLQDGAKRTLGTFVALPVREVLKDDGLQSAIWLEIEGWDSARRPLPRQFVSMAKFNTMEWVGTGWGLRANIMPGNGVRDRLRSAIASVGAAEARREVMYTHYGWRRLDGKWCYLYQGGCIGATDVTVDLGEGLTAYRLDRVPDGISRQDAACASLQLTLAIAQRVSVPLLGATYLAPLREFLAQGGCDPAFALFLYGRTGTRKSTAAALFLSHFGEFGSRSLPASFNDTANYIRRKAFAVKDALLVVDDYHPTSSAQERKMMERTAQSLARAFGDHAERGRLGADLSIQTSMPPRSLAVISGEDVPDIGESGVSRYYIINVEVDDVPANDSLTEMQSLAQQGALRAAMRGYIEWLIPQTDGLAQELAEMFYAYRARAQACFRGEGAHGRTVEAVAQIMIGLTMMNRYFASTGLYDAEGAAAATEDCWQIVTENSRMQAESSRADKPARMFVAALRELLASKACTVIDIAPGAGRATPDKGMIGYADATNYYLLGESAYGAAVKFYRDQDRVFPVKRGALYRELIAEKYVVEYEKGKSTRMKRTPDGKNQRLLWLPRRVLDGDSPPEQTEMDFTPVPEDELPDEMR